MRQTGNRMKFSIPGKRIIEVILGHNRWLQKSIRLFGQRKGLAASISSWHCLNVCDIWREAHSLCHSWDIHIKPLTYFWLIVWHKHIRVLAITDYANNPLNSKFLLLVISENLRPNKLQNLLTTKNVKKFFISNYCPILVPWLLLPVIIFRTNNEMGLLRISLMESADGHQQYR